MATAIDTHSPHLKTYPANVREDSPLRMRSQSIDWYTGLILNAGRLNFT